MKVLATCARLAQCCLMVAMTVWVTLTCAAPNPPMALTAGELAWVTEHQGHTFRVGFDPHAGMDSFQFRGKDSGFVPALLQDMRQQLGLNLVPADTASWDDAYTRFVAGKLDVLYGANATPERERIMLFTALVMRYPYVVFARVNSAVQMIGDLDGKKIGFMANDFVSSQLPLQYPNIAFQRMHFSDQAAGLKALMAGTIDGFVTTGGGVEHEIMFNFPQVAVIAQVRSVVSDMTFAVPKDQQVLWSILNRYVSSQSARIAQLTEQSVHLYNRKILRLTPDELDWLERRGHAVVGVAEDYLPYDYYNKGQYYGIAGATFKRIAELVGLRYDVVSGPFDEVYNKAKAGEIDVLNLAKTDERLPHFIYPRPISTERDIIVGLKTSAPVQDVYGLEGKTVAVIKGFWHEEYLRKNLKNARMVVTDDIKASLALVNKGKVDYLIENPTVAEFYINGLGYGDLVKRGDTSKDSFVYLGVTRGQPHLASIMDKALTLVRFEDVKYAGVQSVPTLRNVESQRLLWVVIGLGLALVVILVITVKIVFSLGEQKAQTRLLQERQKFLYTDPLTGFANRNAFSSARAKLDNVAFPQAVLVADLNNLKIVNDTYGHAAGDAVIVCFAAVMRACFPKGQFFRIGGDEFLCFLDGAAPHDVLAALARVAPTCASMGHDVPGKGTVYPSAALGYAVRPDANLSLDNAIAQADERMYAAKANIKKRRTDKPSPRGLGVA